VKKVNKLFGQRLKKEREIRGLTQADLAKEVKVSVPTIAEYEAGKKMPRHNKLIILAKTLNVSTDYLLGLTDIKEPAHMIKRPKITDLKEYILNKYPTRNGKLISEEEARIWNKIFEKLIDAMETAGDDEKKNGTTNGY
jgi:transcriptional regulator with XRE-family HTH domain